MLHTKINSKSINNLNIRPTTIKLLEVNIGSMLFDISFTNNFKGFFPKARETKGWDYIKLKSLCITKETIKKTRKQPSEWKKIFANNISDKGL